MVGKSAAWLLSVIEHYTATAAAAWRSLANLAFGARDAYDRWDGQQPNFFVRVSEAEKQAFIFFSRHTHPSWSLERMQSTAHVSWGLDTKFNIKSEFPIF